MTNDVKTPDPVRDTIRDGTREASAAKVHDLAWLEFEKPDPDRYAVDQAAVEAVDAFTVPWKLEIQL